MCDAIQIRKGESKEEIGVVIKVIDYVVDMCIGSFPSLRALIVFVFSIFHVVSVWIEHRSVRGIEGRLRISLPIAINRPARRGRRRKRRTKRFPSCAVPFSCLCLG